MAPLSPEDKLINQKLLNLIQKYKPAYRAIWDANSPNYRDREFRDKTWSDIGHDLNESVDVLVERWEALRKAARTSKPPNYISPYLDILNPGKSATQAALSVHPNPQASQSHYASSGPYQQRPGPSSIVPEPNHPSRYNPNGSNASLGTPIPRSTRDDANADNYNSSRKKRKQSCGRNVTTTAKHSRLIKDIEKIKKLCNKVLDDFTQIYTTTESEATSASESESVGQNNPTTITLDM